MSLPAFAENCPDPTMDELDALARHALHLGREVVEISGTLDEIDKDARSQASAMATLKSGAKAILEANQSVENTALDVKARAEGSRASLQDLIDHIRQSSDATGDLSEWVAALEGKFLEVSSMLSDVRKSNDLVSSIASQVNILAINAKIEAARAGDAGRSFAVVAEEVNALSKKTAETATQISKQVQDLGSWITDLSAETKTYGDVALCVRTGAARTDEVVGDVRQRIVENQSDAETIVAQTAEVRAASDGFGPTFSRIEEGASDTSTRIIATRARIHGLIDVSESMVQGTVAIGGTAEDAIFIEQVTKDADTLGQLLTDAVAAGKIDEATLFSASYTPIPGSDPEQVMAPFTELTDALFPAIQDATAAFDERVVFCAAVDRNGYLPTHNRKFSQPQGLDPVWNAANCRNRRIFDDRVGLKAGRNDRAFLLQVYRRDMGGGEFRMMKDLSAPIFACGKHWGGLRLAYTF